MAQKMSYKALYEEVKQEKEDLLAKILETRILSLLFLYKLGGKIEMNSDEIQNFLDTNAPVMFYELDNEVKPPTIKYRLANEEETKRFFDEQKKEEQSESG